MKFLKAVLVSMARGFSISLLGERSTLMDRITKAKSFRLTISANR